MSTRFASERATRPDGRPETAIRPVARLRVAAGAAVALAMIAGIVLLAETLRHPPPSGGPPVPELDAPEADPRTPVECEGQDPREGRARAQTEAEPVAREVTSNELYDCPHDWDGRLVRYRGEAVGAVLQRSHGAWVHLNDDIYGDPIGPLPTHRDYRGGNAGIGVLVPLELARSISFVGGPQAQGDILEVIGTFHRVDPASAEVAVIRADQGLIAATGQPITDPTLPDRRAVAVILVVLALAAVIAERMVARRR
ncbi:MAG: hypothetical protein GEU81_16590 [Nitriliruptorales bacterium]|nr:hypothetical protein [Nitriliruptorales bacterium]